MTSRFRSISGAPLSLRPIWYCYQPAMAQHLTPEGLAPHLRGFLPNRAAAIDIPTSISIPIDRGGVCFDKDELRLDWPYVVEGGQLRALIAPLPAIPPVEEGEASSSDGTITP
jgi:hypothetical protein